jgi:ATP-binding cassette subfamily B protein
MSGEFYENEEMQASERSVTPRQAFVGLLPYLYKYRKSLSFCLGILAVATVLSLLWPILLKRAIDIDIASGDMGGLLLTVLAIGIIQAATLLLQYIQTIKLETIGQDVMVELKQALFDHILSLDVSFFDKNPIGRLMARIESDTESLRMLFTNTAVMLVGDLILVVGIFSIMLYYSPRLTFILMAILPIIFALIVIFVRITGPRYLAVRKSMADVTARLTEFLHGISIIQVFGRAPYARERLDQANRLKFKNDSFVNMAAGVFFNTVFLFEHVAIGLVLYFGAIWAGTGQISVGTVGMLIILIWRGFEPTHRASEQLANIQKAVAGARRIFALLACDEKLPDSKDAVSWTRFEKAIRFENVWFSYNGDDDYVLRDVSFELPVGKRVALAGVTGGGKSTIVSLLLRFYDPQRGRITIDGIDIRHISKEELRRRFALVLQDIILFPGDVASNISLDSNGAEHEKVAASAKIVEADRFIKKLSSGYRTEVSEKGADFSRGERQLLSFARALYAKPDILILDEATSSVDPETERTIQESMRRLLAGRTSLVIAHRLSTILDVDEILVLRHGEIIERGTHTELILAGGYYSKLFHLQFKNGVMANAK